MKKRSVDPRKEQIKKTIEECTSRVYQISSLLRDDSVEKEGLVLIKDSMHEPDLKLTNKNLMEFKCSLHPNISKACRMPPTAWVPGYKRTYIANDSWNEKVVRAKKLFRPTYFKSKQHHYDPISVEEARSKPIVRCSSAYITQEELRRREEKIREDRVPSTSVMLKNSKRMITKKLNFKTRFSTSDLKGIGNTEIPFLHSQTKYRNINSHSFRVNDKKRWIAGDFKNI